MNQIQKLKRYKKYKIRAWIFSADEWFDGTLKVHVLRFVRLDNNDANSMQQSEEFSNIHNKDELIEALEQSIKDDASEPGNNSLDSLGAENNKQLREAKALISEKNSPKNIKFLNRIFLGLMIALFLVYVAIFVMVILKN